MTVELRNPFNDPRRQRELQSLRQRVNEGVDTTIDIVAGVFPVVLFVLAAYFVGSLAVFWNVGL